MHTGRLHLNPRIHAPLFIGSGMATAYCLFQPEVKPIIFALAGLAMGTASGWSWAKGLRACVADPTLTPETHPLIHRARSLFFGGLAGVVVGAFLRSPEPLWAVGAGVGALVWSRELLSLGAMALWANQPYASAAEEANREEAGNEETVSEEETPDEDNKGDEP